MISERTRILPPTQQLPPIRSLKEGTYVLSEIESSIKYLRNIYNPQVRGSKRRDQTQISRDGLLESDNAYVETNTLASITADSFERNFAIRWLTAFIAHAGTAEQAGSDSVDRTVLEETLENAASLLAACSGAAATGTLSRPFTFGPSPNGEEINIVLTDAPLESQDFSSVGAQTWGGAVVLAEMILENPSLFAIPLHAEIALCDRPFRVLELGAGTGLVGLAVYRLLADRSVQSTVTLTDFHPSVLKNLARNVDTNRLLEYPTIEVTPLDWQSFPTTADESRCNKLTGSFDLILGADIIYEENHSLWIKACLERLLRRPDNVTPDAIFHLVIPLRATHATESSTVERVFPFISATLASSLDAKLAILHKERIVCDAHGSVYDTRSFDRADEVCYAYYKIGWT